MKQTELKAISEKYPANTDNVSLEFVYDSQMFSEPERIHVWVMRTLTGQYGAVLKGNGIFSISNSDTNVADLINNQLQLKREEFESLEFVKDYKGWLPRE